MTDSAVSSDELDKLNRETQALRNELAGVRRAHLSAVKSGNGIDPVVALLFVFGGVAAGFLTVALVKRALAKKK
jgi:hypothetical protein